MKIIHVVLGLGTAVILASLINLGIRAFHPEPVSPYERGVEYPKPLVYREFNCDRGDAKCVTERDEYYRVQQTQQEELDRLNREYQDAMEAYNRDVFVIANLVGIAVFLAGFFTLFKTAIVSQSVPIGVMIAGLWSIFYGYVRGWQSTDDQMKFFVGLAIAALVIGGSIWLVERYHRRIGNQPL